MLFNTEEKRFNLQISLDKKKSKLERNILGQFSTPYQLALQMMQFGINLLDKDENITFLDPAFGTGTFYSALIETVSKERIKIATGFELDEHYALPSSGLWNETNLNLRIQNFLEAEAPKNINELYNFVICNPPYVRHHHIPLEKKIDLKRITSNIYDKPLSGLSGLYCYFLGVCHNWLKPNGVAGWLMPSEFMDVNYGESVKHYLLNKVTLLRVHRFEPDKLQFNDALVSSSIVWFKNAVPKEDNAIEFTFGGSLIKPVKQYFVDRSKLQPKEKWSQIQNKNGNLTSKRKIILSEVFDIKRGLATGDNNYFILNKQQIEEFKIESEFLKPILPSPRFLKKNFIERDQNNNLNIEQELYLFDCRLSEVELAKYNGAKTYIEKGIGNVSTRYLCHSRKIWYFQELRKPAPILCTYMGRKGTTNSRPFNFILNRTDVIASNSYLMLYPREKINKQLNTSELLESIWQELNKIPISIMTQEGRTYGGGLHKLEPKELANVDISSVLNKIPFLSKIIIDN